MPRQSGGAQLLHQRVDAEAQVEVEHDGAVFDQQVAVAIGAADDAGRVRRIGVATPGASGRRGRAVGHVVVERGVQLRGLVGETARKRTVSPGRSWPIFQSSACDDGRRADEAAEAGTVGAEDDRHVAGEIDRADGVGVVVDVGGMQAGFAAVLARPCGLRADQAHAGAVGVVVHLPGGREERLDVVGGEEIGRAVRAVEDADLPVVGVRGRRHGRRAGVRRCAAAPRCSTSPARRARPAWPPNWPRVKVLRLPRYSRHVDAARDGEIGARARALRAAEFAATAPAGTATALPAVDGLAIERRAEIRAGEGDRRCRSRSAASGPVTAISSPARVVRIADQAVGGAEGEGVHRAGRRHADVPVAEPARDSPARWSARRLRARRWRGGGRRSVREVSRW